MEEHTKHAYHSCCLSQPPPPTRAFTMSQLHQEPGAASIVYQQVLDKPMGTSLSCQPVRALVPALLGPLTECHGRDLQVDFPNPQNPQKETSVANFASLSSSVPCSVDTTITFIKQHLPWAKPIDHHQRRHSQSSPVSLQ